VLGGVHDEVLAVLRSVDPDGPGVVILAWVVDDAFFFRVDALQDPSGDLPTNVIVCVPEVVLKSVELLSLDGGVDLHIAEHGDSGGSQESPQLAMLPGRVMECANLSFQMFHGLPSEPIQQSSRSKPHNDLWENTSFHVSAFSWQGSY
jgi:hypothetical protein